VCPEAVSAHSKVARKASNVACSMKNRQKCQMEWGDWRANANWPRQEFVNAAIHQEINCVVAHGPP
jgi:hypothetical protein